jgi:predicted dehydrogenase
MAQVEVGIIGGGLMGRELAGALGRWPTVDSTAPVPVLTAACDVDERARSWFERVGSVRLLTDDYRRLLDDPRIEVVYVAVPHDLHESVFLDVIAAGKDFMGEKPFGIDLSACERIVAALHERPAVFARCSSEMPFFPGAQRCYAAVRDGLLGRVIEAGAALLHSSDINLAKPINWKRRKETCGPAGVMADLGMHTWHLPLRVGWQPTAVHAVLQDLVPQRTGADGRLVDCDTYENATLVCSVSQESGAFPLTVENKRIAPGESNTWRFRAVGLGGGVDFTTRSPTSWRRFELDGSRQAWIEEQTGMPSAVRTSAPQIAEFGFGDAILQMWAAFLAERAGADGLAFGCATPQEALTTHRIFEAALMSASERREVRLDEVSEGVQM